MQARTQVVGDLKPDQAPGMRLAAGRQVRESDRHQSDGAGT